LGSQFGPDVADVRAFDQFVRFGPEVVGASHRRVERRSDRSKSRIVDQDLCLQIDEDR
jgi:hypothetical protein